MLTMTPRLLVPQVAIVLATLVVSLAAPAQEEAPPAPSSQEAAADDSSEETSDTTTPLWQVEPEASEPADESSDAAAAGDAPPPDPSAAAAEASPELKVIPVPEEPVAPVVADDSGGVRLENVVVQAQKREQGMQDVPISMTVLTEEFIRAQGITDLTDAMRYVPGIKVVERYHAVAPQCRGFTVDDANPAFEPPCGVAMDGIFYSRAAYFSAGLFDIERLEALMGPQGTTFGKNTTAGVVSIYSKNPTDSFSGRADVQYGALYRRAEAAFGGPLFRDVVNFRVAVLKEERQGYMENTYHLTDSSASPMVGGRERESYRATLAFPDVLGGQIKLLHEGSELVTRGLIGKFYSEPGSSMDNYIKQHDPNYDGGENYKASQLGNQDIPTPTVRTHAEWTAPFGGWDVTLLGATGRIKRDHDVWLAIVPVRWVRAERQEDSPFVTGELRTVSPDFDGLFGLQDLFGWNLGSSRLVAGIFGQENRIKKLNGRGTLYYVPTAGVIAATLPAQGLFLPDATFYAAQEQTRTDAGSEYVQLNFRQTVNTLAGFAQGSWDMTPEWTLELGGRFSREEKVGDWEVYSWPTDRTAINRNGGYTAHEEIGDESFQPKISLGYKLTDGINLFAHWARAYKSAGFNYYTPSGDPRKADPPGKLTFDPETATDVGFDIKMMLLDNRMRFNVSLYQLDLTDYQVLTEVPGTEIKPYDPNTGGSVNAPDNYQAVVNAGRARAKGAEINLHYLPFDWLSVIGAAGYNASKFIYFPLDSCGGNESPDPETQKCDHSGKAFRNVPRWTTSLTVDTKFPLGGYWSALGDLELTLGGGVEYVTETHFDGGYTGCCFREPYALYRGNVGVGSLGQGWSFKVVGLNLADEYIYAVRENAGTYTAGAPMPPRTVFGQLNYTFY